MGELAMIRHAWEQGFVSLVSYLLSLDLAAIGDHIRRESKRQANVLRRWLVAVGILTSMVIAGAWYGWWQSSRAEAIRAFHGVQSCAPRSRSRVA